MAPSMYTISDIPPSTTLTPTSDNRGVPLWKTHQYQSPLQQPVHSSQVKVVPHRRKQPRPLTVNEALQYSPLSSIVPFESGIIPLPNADLSTSQPLFVGPAELQIARQSVNFIDKELAQYHGRSEHAQNVLRNIRPLLDADCVSEFKFKIPRGHRSEVAKIPPLETSDKQENVSSRIGPFANMVLNATEVAYRCEWVNEVPISRFDTLIDPTPNTPGLSPAKISESPPPHPPRLPATPATPVQLAYNEIARSQNASLPTVDEILQNPSSIKLHPVVLVPPLPTSSHPDQFKVFPVGKLGLTSTPTESRKRKRDQLSPHDQGSGKAKDPKEISTTALDVLQEILAEIFEAENNLHIDGLEANPIGTSNVFISCDGTEGTALTLAPATHVKIEPALNKVITLGRYQEIPIDHLSRLQGICEGGISSAITIDITAETAPNDEDHPRWLDNVISVETGLRSARTVLRTMVGGREERQIYPEELLQKILDLLRKVMDSCIIPVVESRVAGSQSEVFQFASSYKRPITQLNHAVGKIMQLLSELLVKVELAESTINTMEFLFTRILFVENAHNEKDSVLGVHKFEAIRRKAMDIIAEIFLRYSEQRTFIFNEILTSLQKLPTTRQHARQYKLGDGKNIQLVSALIMRLVQTSGTCLTSRVVAPEAPPFPIQNAAYLSDADQGDDGDSQSGDASSVTITANNKADGRARDGVTSVSLMQSQANEMKSLNESSIRSAQHVVKFFVTRASTASKTGDQPYRHLLDIFVEDLVAVLSSPDWPASELLLRAVVSVLDEIIASDKSTAPAKNMALELFGLLGCAISETTATAQQLSKNLESDDSKFSEYLAQLVDDYVTGKVEEEEFLKWTGPYRAVIESLHVRSSDDGLISSAEGYILTQWSKIVYCDTRPTSETYEPFQNDCAVKLYQSLSAGRWICAEDFESVSSSQCRLAYVLIILNMGFCRTFRHLLKVLLDHISSDQITVRSRSLKSVTQILEKDPTILDRTPSVIKLILNSTSDPSSMVRDSALTLIGKCIILKPALEFEVCKSIMACSDDVATGIRKRSMKLLKDIYCRNSRKDLKAVISESLLQRAKDSDETIADLARQMFEEMWLAPFLGLTNSSQDSAEARIALRDQVVLLIKTVQRGDTVASVLELLVGHILSKASKNVEENTRVCKAMVAIAFDGMIDNRDLPDTPNQQHILQTLTVFAKASPSLFTQSQLGHLQPYISSLNSSEDLNLFRSVVVIFRHVLPTLSAVQLDFLKAIQDDLLQTIQKLAKSELNEVVACLWTINGKLLNIDRLIKLTTSILARMHKIQPVNDSPIDNQKDLSTMKRFLYLAAHFGKHCDFEMHFQVFKASLPWITGDSVASVIIDHIMSFTGANQPLALRYVAFDSIGMMCQAWPKNYNRPELAHTFQKVLRKEHVDLQRIVLFSFRDFFATQDHQDIAKHNTEANSTTNGKLGRTATASDNDGAAALIAQGFLNDIVRIALASQDAYALAATEVIASISRQGLVHPKECGPALVALETSTNLDIAGIAFQEHRSLHQQHESTFERQYMRAIHEAFVYQRDVVKDALGAIGQPYKSKLRSMFEIIKTSKGKYQTKFLSNFCARVDFDLAELDVGSNSPPHLQYSRFLIENIAFFEYGRVDDVQHILLCMERITAGTGAGVAHAINTEILQVRLDASTEASNDVPQNTSIQKGDLVQDMTLARLRQLCTASMILSMLWEARTYLRRLYGLGQQRRENKTKPSAKDLNKPPTKANGVTGDKVMDAIAKISEALENHEKMISQCKAFAELLSIDSELKVPAEVEDEHDGRPETSSVEDDGDAPISVNGGPRIAKRKGSALVVSTPQKKKRGRPSLGGRKKSGRSADEEEDLY